MTGHDGVLAGRYRLVGPIAPVGGVPRDLAVDTMHDVQVEVARFARSGAVPRGFAEQAARYMAVRHPCLAPVIAYTEPGADLEPDPLVVEQHIEGARVGPGVALPRRQALLVVADVADAIAALHAARLVHAALGPEAVTLDRAGRAIVCGAGSTILQAAALGGVVTDVTPADDLRAVGRLLYTLLCGREPATPARPPAELVPDLEPALNGLVLSLLSDEPLRQPPPAAAAALRLRDIAGEPAPASAGGGMIVARAPAPMRTTPSRSGGDFTLLAGVAALALLGVAAAFAVSRSEETSPAPVTATTTQATSTLSLDTTSLPGSVSVPPTVPVVVPSVLTETATSIVTETATGPSVTEPFPGTVVTTTATTTFTAASATTTTLTVPVTVTVPPSR